MRWLRSTVEGAGLAGYGAGVVLCFSIGCSVLLGLMAAMMTGIAALGACLTLGAFGFSMEALSLRAKARRRELASLWPQVFDSLQSAAFAGLPISEAFAELAESGPFRLAKTFGGAVTRLESGHSLMEVLDWLKAEFGEHHGDKLFELIRVSHLAGGQAYLSAIREQAAQVRRALALSGELESKQGWITGTAKLAVAAPWLIVAMLSSRPETAATYNAPQGVIILTIGLLVSVFAYRLIHLFGALPEHPRVLASS